MHIIITIIIILMWSEKRVLCIDGGHAEQGLRPLFLTFLVDQPTDSKGTRLPNRKLIAFFIDMEKQIRLLGWFLQI